MCRVVLDVGVVVVVVVVVDVDVGSSARRVLLARL